MTLTHKHTFMQCRGFLHDLMKSYDLYKDMNVELEFKCEGSSQKKKKKKGISHFLRGINLKDLLISATALDLTCG